MATNWKLTKLSETHAIDAFTCGTRPGAAEIDRYLRESALTEQAAGLASVWVVEDVSASTREDQLVGVFTLSPVSVRISPDLLAAMGIAAPYAQIGGWLLGRMGLSIRHQGQGYGRLLVATAVRTAREWREQTAGVLLAVDPKNAKLRQWYLDLDFGFHRLESNDSRLLRLVMKL
jgi:GNAT superfamily N-acetyltransferase